MKMCLQCLGKHSGREQIRAVMDERRSISFGAHHSLLFNSPSKEQTLEHGDVTAFDYSSQHPRSSRVVVLLTGDSGSCIPGKWLSLVGNLGISLGVEEDQSQSPLKMLGSPGSSRLLDAAPGHKPWVRRACWLLRRWSTLTRWILL